MSDYKEYEWKHNGKSTVDGSDRGKHADGGGGSGCMVVVPAAGVVIGTLLAVVKATKRS